METGLIADSSETRRQPRLRGWRLLALAAALAFVALLLIRTFLLDVFFIPSSSMEPTFEPGDRIIVSKLEAEVQRGDIVVFDGTGSFSPYVSGSPWAKNPVKAAGQWLGLVGSDTVYIKRVIGVAGDTVECCSSGGALTVNGQPVDEPYLYPGDDASDVEFSVKIPEGRMWVMGDHRSGSMDSRALMGAPGGGMIKVDTVIGHPAFVAWPAQRWGSPPE